LFLSELLPVLDIQNLVDISVNDYYLFISETIKRRSFLAHGSVQEEIMRIYFFIPILILVISQNLYGQIKSENSSVEVLSSKWSKSRQKIENPDNQAMGPAQKPVTAANKNFERNVRVNDPVGALDPNKESMEGRSATLDKNMKESRSPKLKSVDGFMYEARFRNASAKIIEILFWEYQFKELANPANVSSRQFLCGVNIKPDKAKDLKIFSTHSPGNLISADSLDNKTGNIFEEKILINRVEYADGTIWQRKDWNYNEMKTAINQALETPWGFEICRNL
jgi:hypothetical protein